MITPLQILEKYWGFSSFKSKQEEIITSVLDGKDTVALLPTGGGKSICFQVPALTLDGICIVVSPLVALMTDQVKNLQQKGIKALAISGGISFNELSTLLDNALYGNYKFLYLSPERLQQEIVQNVIKQMHVNCIAVDEAHCISQWGNDFRPAYKNIVLLRQLHPLVPIIAVTATATPTVLQDTIEQLTLELPNVVKDSFTRKNISYQVLKETDKLYRLQQLLQKNTGSAIVYVRSRKSAAEVSQQLNSLGISSTFYHGGISVVDKNKRLDDWRNGRVSTMVATNAFGMGIDHPTVRFVVHIQLPESIESYFQEAGRAGRDGNPATAIILYSDYDKTILQRQFIDSLPTPSDVKKLYRTLHNYFHIPYGEGEFTQHSFSFSEFCKTYKLNSIHTYNGLTTLDRLGIIQLSKEFGRKSSIRFIVSSERLLSYFSTDVQASVIGKTILRLYGGIFETPTGVNLDLVVKKSGQHINDVISVLKKMERDLLLELTLHVTDASLTFLVPREDDKTINVVAKEINVLNDKKKAQVTSVLAYIENTSECRSLQLVHYFGEENTVPCGICSVCASETSEVTKKEAVAISEKIKVLLKEAPRSSRELSEKLTFTEAKITTVLHLLIAAEAVKLNSKNQYYI
ncbi:RecQ family ATP-dependent DNA helicase [Ulvibacter litoralis]|uniref:ATP-dependent DNA helicase RecQ n=1 Tax=Ulvibacter litoralis TaxID=227084 RepID=A0A1G7F678_9FLAO|nr:ATP-dependent DNA helicase RecQ [Ulvibacter litoralis]GHC52543.1 ATP-dependent DNA helicase RecQ2 [Ulvibacter litoralis]SDE71286.1 ATP-dependent DNA helicase RecQ [Ulvibacter litoralis]